jgi:hypothetical protein
MKQTNGLPVIKITPVSSNSSKDWIWPASRKVCGPFFCPETAGGKGVTRKSKKARYQQRCGPFCLLTSQGDGFLNCQCSVHQKSGNSNKKMPANLTAAG